MAKCLTEMLLDSILGREQPTTSKWSLRATSSGLVRSGGAKVRQETSTQRVVRSLPQIVCVWFLLCWLSNIGAFAWSSECSPNDQLEFASKEFASKEPVSELVVQSALSTFAPCWGAVWANLIAAVLCLQEVFELWTCGLSFVLGLFGSAFNRVLLYSGVHTPSKKVWQARFVGKRRFRHHFRKKHRGLNSKRQPKYACFFLKIPEKWFSSRPTSGHTDLPQTGLNNMFRGGAGGSAATARRRAETNEQALLTGLQSLLLQFGSSSDQSSKGKGKGKSKSSEPLGNQYSNAADVQSDQSTGRGRGNPSNGKGKGKAPHTAPISESNDMSDSALLQALERIIARARRTPGTLLQRLTGLVKSASQGQPLSQKVKNKRSSAAQVVSTPQQVEPQAKRPRVKPPAVVPQEVAQTPAATSSAKRTWAEVAKGSGKSISKGSAQRQVTTPTAGDSQPMKTKPHPALLRDAFPVDAIVNAQDVQKHLEDGKVPKGVVSFCPNQRCLDDCLRLAKLHDIPGDTSFALVSLPQADFGCPVNAKEVILPTWEEGRPHVRKFWAFALGKTLPILPEQKIRQTKVTTPETSLITFRVTVVRHFVTKDFWEAFKRNPVAGTSAIWPMPLVHSTYGWQEKKVQAKKQSEPDLILQGYLRCKHEFRAKILAHVGDDGVFVDDLASSSHPRVPVFWIHPFEEETPSAYLARATLEAKKDGSTLAHRRGGGAALGVRMLPGKRRLCLRTWALHGVPKVWSAQDVCQCLTEAECEQVSVVRPPGRFRYWLVRCVVKDDCNLGVVAIQTENLIMTLTREQSAVKRHTEVVSHLRPISRRPDAVHAVQSGKGTQPLTKPLVVDVEKSQASEKRDRSRSPAKQETEAPLPFPERIEVVDCGSGGNCGYLSLAMALSLEKGEAIDKVKPILEARAKTIRHDLYKHMKKHANEYEEWYSPALHGSESVEAGPVPTDWTSWLESTLRNGRWVDGLSLLAAASRFGTCITVIPCTGNPKDQPMRFGKPRSGKSPIVLILRDNHYQLATLKPGKQWPQTWIQAEEASVSSAWLRGGGKPAFTPIKPVHKVRLETPKSKTSSARAASGTKHSWRADSTPASCWRAAETPPPSFASSSKDLNFSKAAAWRPAQTPNKADSWRPSSTPDKTPKSGFSGPDRAGMRTWICPICGVVRKGQNYAQLAHHRRSHGKGCHPEVNWRFFLTREFIQVVEASPDLAEADRDWECPFCPAALPKQAVRPRQRAVAAHRRKCHPKVSIEKWKAAMMSKRHKGTRKPESSQQNRTRADAYRAKWFKSHQIVEIPSPCPGAAKFRRQNEFWCVACFTKVGGYGGGSRVRHEKLTCRQSQKLPQAKQRVNAAWKKLKKCKTVDNEDILPQASTWVRSLLNDGDVEANPGPSNRCLSCVSVNVAGFTGLWSSIRLLLSGHETPDIVLLQEVSIRKADIASISHSVFPRGYSFFCQKGHENAQGGHRGVGVFVRRSLGVRPLKFFSFDDGQALAILVEGVIIITMYTACDGCPDLHQEILEWLGANAGHAPWFLVGDHNVLPHEHELFSLLKEDGAQYLVH